MKVTDQGFPKSFALPQVHLGLSRLSTVCTRCNIFCTRCSTICTRVDSSSTSRVDCRSILVQRSRGCRHLHDVTSSTSCGWSELPLDSDEQADEKVWQKKKKKEHKVNTSDSAIIFLIIFLISQNQWSGWSRRRRWSGLVFARKIARMILIQNVYGSIGPLMINMAFMPLYM